MTLWETYFFVLLLGELHGASTLIHPIDSRFIANITKTLGQQMKPFFLLIAKISHEINGILIRMNTGKEISFNHIRQFP